MKNKARALHANMSSMVRRDTVDSREYLVCPTILINEGVWNGVMYPAAELSKHVDAWNGRPLVNGHPTVRGKPVTANSKKVMETLAIGMVLNAAWDDNLKALKADAYVDIEKCKARAPRVLEKLEAEEPCDVSTGLFTDDDMRANSFNGKDFECTAMNHRPDHLAILPDSRGACSWGDGAGLCRINEAGDDDELDPPEEATADAAPKQNSAPSLLSRVASFFGYKTNDNLEQVTEPKLNEASFQERIEKIQKALQEKICPAVTQWGPFASPATPSPWVMDVYETWLVYSCGNATYKASYAWDPELETVTLQGEPEEVTQKRVFVPKTNGGPGSGNFGHSGRKGEQGGSGGGGGGKGAATDDSFEGKHEAAFKQAADQMRIEGSRTVRQGDVFDKLMNDRSYMDAVEELVKADLGKSASEDDQRDAIDDRVSADARKIVTAFKRNESLDPRGSEQPPTWAQHEGSPSMDKLMKVNSLIENGHLNAGLRETMLAAPEAVVMAFDQLASKQVAPKTLKNMMEALPEDEKKKLADALAAKKLKDEEDAGSMKKLSDEVKANAACPFTPEQVDALSLPMLKTLAEKLPKGKANHAPGAPAGTPKANADDDAAPEMPSLDEAIKANEALRASK